MKATGIILALVGMLIVVSALFMDVTAETALPSYTPFSALPSVPSSIVNLSKLQSQMLVFVGGWGVCLAGLILAVGGWIAQLINPGVHKAIDAVPVAPIAMPTETRAEAAVVDPDDAARLDAERNAREAREMKYLMIGAGIFVLVILIAVWLH